MPSLTLPTGRGQNRVRQMEELAKQLIVFSEEMNLGFKVGARGWGYIAETEGLIDKTQINRVGDLINELRKEGLLPLKFTADSENRKTCNIEKRCHEKPADEADWIIDEVIEYHVQSYAAKSFWDDLDIYVEVAVEKIDLVGLFMPVVEPYRIPITNYAGWTDFNSRADLIERMQQHADKKRILLYVGDFDPAGLLISETLPKNLHDLRKATGWDALDDPEFSVQRIGLDYDFIIEHGFTWIDNLLSGNKDKHKADMSKTSHKSYETYKVADYIEKYGVRKCEANVLVTNSQVGRKLLADAIALLIPDSYVESYDAQQQADQVQLRTELASRFK